MIHKLGAELGAMFEIKLLGPLPTYLGMDIVRDREEKTITLSQQNFTQKTMLHTGMLTISLLFPCYLMNIRTDGSFQAQHQLNDFKL